MVRCLLQVEVSGTRMFPRASAFMTKAYPCDQLAFADQLNQQVYNSIISRSTCRPEAPAIPQDSSRTILTARMRQAASWNAGLRHS